MDLTGTAPVRWFGYRGGGGVAVWHGSAAVFPVTLFGNETSKKVAPSP